MRDIRVTDVRISFGEYGTDLEIDVTVGGVEYTATEAPDGDAFTVTVTRVTDGVEVVPFSGIAHEHVDEELHALITDAVFASWHEVGTILKTYRKTMATMATAKIRKSLRVQAETAADEVG